MEARLSPHVVLFDLPPVLAQDDVLALKPHLDCILMVAGGGVTTQRDLREAGQRLGEDLPILGVVLNMAEGEEILDYHY
jgi:Mrp family chromosome partitioning ATPase